MLSKELKTDFYEKVRKKQRVVVLSSIDVDSICACKILISLFIKDSIQYTLQPVYNTEQIEQAFLEHSPHCESFIFINCGATLEIADLLNPHATINIFIIDSHRPIHFTNIFSEQIYCLVRETENLDEIPKFEELFREFSSDEESAGEEDEDDEEDDGDENDDPEAQGSKRRRKQFDDNKFIKQAQKTKEKRIWDENKTQILRQYEESTSFSTSAAEIAYDLSFHLSKDSNPLLWMAIIGLTDQFLMGRIAKSSREYLTERDFLGSHVRRLNAWIDNDTSSIVSVDCMKICVEKELRLYLYRHWTLWESMHHSIFTESQFKLWSHKGEKRLFDFLSYMGLSLKDCKQKFRAIKTSVRNEINGKVISTYDKHYKQGLKTNIWFSSFTAQYGVQNKFSALDVTLAVNALLENPNSKLTTNERFSEALDALSYINHSTISDAIETCKLMLKAIWGQVCNVLACRHAMNTGPFVLVSLSDSSPDIKFFSGLNSFKLLGIYLINCAVSNNNRWAASSFVISAPSPTDPLNTLIVGFPPLALMETKVSNLFGKAFEAAAEMTQARVIQNFFESNILEIRNEDKGKFYDALTTIMSK